MVALDVPFDDDEVEANPLDLTRPFRWPCMIAPGLPRLTNYVPHPPHPKQRIFLCLAVQEAFYGGAAGGAKSDAMLMAALQFVDVPGYAALILREDYQQLSLPGALMDRAHDWLDDTDAHWVAQTKTWEFPAGATLTFGYAQNDRDVRRYQSAEVQFIGIDESTQFSEFRYRFLFSRLRRPSKLTKPKPSADGLTLDRVPMRMRTAANPGGIGHVFHKRRFVDVVSRRPDIVFVPSRAEDNPSIDLAAYEANLKRTFPTEWRRLRYGDWNVSDPGEIFDRTRVGLVSAPFGTESNIKRVRYWDMAGTEVKAGASPDFSVGMRLALDTSNGLFRVEHVVHMRGEPSIVQRRMQTTAAQDGPSVPVVIEQEPGSEGKHFIDIMRRTVLRGSSVHGDKVQVAKPARIALLEPLVNSGDLSVVQAQWTDEFLDELDAWPNVEHVDQVDALAGAHRWLTKPRGRLRA